MAGITHHLTDDLLLGYAAGSLPEAFNLVVATHVSLCDECRARLAAFETLGGSVLDEGDSVDMSEGSLEATLRLIAGGPKDPIRRAPAPRRAGIFPAPLAEYTGGGPELVRWRSVGMGVKQAILPTSKDATVRLLYIPGGAAMPDHGHRGMELTLVLQGAFRDESARFGRGDVEIADERMEHTPVAEEGDVCICLAATDARLKFPLRERRQAHQHGIGVVPGLQPELGAPVVDEVVFGIEPAVDAAGLAVGLGPGRVAAAFDQRHEGGQEGLPTSWVKAKSASQSPVFRSS
jgi:putative transcriptional regulator